LVIAVAVCLLPENSYQRWQLLGGTIHARARWIYERVHFDPMPIDVAFVGPSRVGSAVDAPRLGAALAARGLPANVVNFSLPENGRNINYAIVAEMMETKRPKLLVIGVIEKPSRYGHAAFKYVAPRGMIAIPSYLGQINYLSDLVYLPYRQLELFAADIAPAASGLIKQFDPSLYLGHSVDTTGSIILPDGTVKDGEIPASIEELKRGVRKLELGTNPPLLPKRFADVEFGDERHYIREIVTLARLYNVRIAFLALPYYTGPSTLLEDDFYRTYGDIWNASFLSSHPDLYSDYGHVTSHGADILTDFLIDRVADELRQAIW
jgi:hypothetical protein